MANLYTMAAQDQFVNYQNKFANQNLYDTTYQLSEEDEKAIGEAVWELIDCMFKATTLTEEKQCEINYENAISKISIPFSLFDS